MFLILLLYLVLFPNNCPALNDTLRDDTTVITGEELKVDDYYVIQILGTGSMEPLISEGGAKAIVKRVENISELRIGNLLAFYPPYLRFGRAHRLIDINGETLELKGDSSNEIQFEDCCDDIYKIYALVKLKEN